MALKSFSTFLKEDYLPAKKIQLDEERKRQESLQEAGIIDTIQTGADFLSMGLSFVPGLNFVGSAIDAISAGVDLAQGQYGDAALRGGAAALGLIPGGGAVAKIGAKAIKGATTIGRSARATKSAASAVNTVAKARKVSAVGKQASQTLGAARQAQTLKRAGVADDVIQKAITQKFGKNAAAQIQNPRLQPFINKAKPSAAPQRKGINFASSTPQYGAELGKSATKTATTATTAATAATATAAKTQGPVRKVGGEIAKAGVNLQRADLRQQASAETPVGPQRGPEILSVPIEGPSTLQTRSGTDSGGSTPTSAGGTVHRTGARMSSRPTPTSISSSRGGRSISGATRTVRSGRSVAVESYKAILNRLLDN